MSKKRKREEKTYTKGKIPYEISEPNRFWRISKNLPADVYWQKRYWRRRITGKGAYRTGRIRGRGDYRMDQSKSFGHRWGGYIGSKVGEFAGAGIQSLAGKLLGFGAYNVRSNVFLEGRLPEVVNVPTGGGTVIRFQEYLCDILTSSTANSFNIQNFLINAANPNTFPFLCQIAQNYEQYVMEGLLFEFKSTSADALNSVNTALGTVIMATQYDVLDTVFASKLDMLNYEYSTSCKPSCSNIHMIECDPRQTSIMELYSLATEDVPAGADARLYHLGRFSIATAGFQGTSVNVGELHVTYQVRLLKPKLFATLGQGAKGYQARLGTYPGSSTVYTNALPLGNGSASYITVSNDTGFSVDQTNHLINFPRTSGIITYMLMVEWIGATAVAITMPVVTYSNCTQIEPLAAPNQTATAGQVIQYICIQTNGNPNTVPQVIFGTAGALPTGNQVIFIRITQVNGDIF